MHAFSRIAFFRYQGYLLTILLSFTLLCIIGLNFRVYGTKQETVYPSHQRVNKLENDIPPWSVTYEGKTVMERQANRLKILREVCKSRNDTKINKFPASILVVDRIKLLYCYIPKVGSTYILETLIAANERALGLPKYEWMSHNNTALARYGIKQLRKYSMKEQKDILTSYYKFIFVRHPISRLRSAHGMFTEQVAKPPGEASPPLLKITAGLLNGTDWKKNGFPRFSKFINIISSKWKKVKQAQNHHWDSFQDLCAPCSVNYDFIGKHENFGEDLNHVLKNQVPEAKLVTSESYKTHWIGLDQIFSSFSKETLMLFMRRFGQDFDFFNYRKEQ